MLGSGVDRRCPGGVSKDCKHSRSVLCGDQMKYDVFLCYFFRSPLAGGVASLLPILAKQKAEI